MAAIAKPRLKPKAATLWGGRMQPMAIAHHAASHADRAMASWTPLRGSADADLIPELGAITARARDLARNNPLASGVVRTQQDNIIGSVLRLSAKPDIQLLGWDAEQARAWSRGTEAHFRTWSETDECDAGRSLNLLGLSLQILGGALVNGDAVCVPLWRPRPGAHWSTRLQLIEADRLDTPPHLAHRSDLRGGVEIDRDGAPLAYWIRKTHPGDTIDWLSRGTPDDFTRIPAFTRWGRRRVIHLHDIERSGQNRGKSIFTSVMKEFHMAGRYTGAELQATLVNAMLTAFIESNLDQDGVVQMLGGQTGDLSPEAAWRDNLSQYQVKMEEGMVIPLPLGAKANPVTPGRPNQAFEAFMHAVLRHIAAGLNMPYELLTKDFSQTNYSSARAALLEAWRYLLSRRRWMVDYWFRPVYALWMEEAVDRGRVGAPDFYALAYAYLRARWTFAGRGWVDPQKEANAAVTRIQNGISTLEDECAEQGKDWEEVLEQRAREQQRLDELGLSLEAVFGPVGSDANREQAVP